MQVRSNTAAEPAHRGLIDLDAFEAMLSVDAGPFSLVEIRAATVRMHQELELASLRAQLHAGVQATVELFCAIARHAPEHLPGLWGAVYEMVASEERYWVYPKVTLGNIEDGMDDAFAPYLNRDKVAAEWETLIAHVQRVVAAQESATANALTA